MFSKLIYTLTKGSPFTNCSSSCLVFESEQEKGILFRRNKNVSLVAYTDSKYASLVETWSTASYCTFFGGNSVTWKSKK